MYSLARLVPMNVHAVGDYAVTIGPLVAMPFLNAPRRAKAIANATCTLGLVGSLLTDYDLSLRKVIPIGRHAALDYAHGATLAMLPRMCGTGTKTAAFLTAVGLATIALSLVTDYRPAVGVRSIREGLRGLRARAPLPGREPQEIMPPSEGTIPGSKETVIPPTS